MDTDTLLENFEMLAEAPGGVDRLRDVILGLATNGLISGSDTSSWRATTLGDEVQIVRGITFPSSAKGRSPGKGLLPCLRTANIQSEVDWEDLLYVSEDFVRNDDQYVQLNDLLISMANSRELVGKVALVRRNDIRCTLGGFIAAIRCGAGIDPKYLMTILRVPSAREKLIDSSTQTTNIANISLSRLRPFVLSLPPLSEQHVIIAKVDELMALCDQLEQQQKQRDNLRTATRKSAIDAISTATTPEELEAAWKRINNNWEVIADTPESIESIRGLILGLGTRIGFGVGIQKSPKRKLNEVSHVSWGNLSLTKTSYVEEGQFLAISAAGPDGRIGHAEHDKYTPVISAIGARCGTMFMPDEKFTAIKNTMTVTPDRKKIDNWYLFYALKGSQLPRRGTAQPFLSKTDIENFEITVPSSLEDQRVIVAKVDELMALCDQLESELKSRSDVGEKFARSVVSAA